MWLPRINTPGYYLLLAALAMFILGPLGGVTAAYMNFSLGFFVGGQVLAGILGSTVTYGYGVEGKHGANYMQTMAASVAGMAGMCVLIQAMVWLGLPQPPTWQLILFFLCIGMYGCGVGMLYTPIVVDKMQLTFPSGFAVANILRALTDKRILAQSVSKLGTGTLVGLIGGLAGMKVPAIEAVGMSTSTLGAGMVVGARITIPAVVIGAVGEMLKPYLVSIGWLDEGAPFRKIGFILALGTIMGAAAVDIVLILMKAAQTWGESKTRVVAPEDDWSRTSNARLFAWIAFWAVELFFVATRILALPPLYVGIAMGLVLLFVLINGISTGISDSNPISSAFVVSVFILAAIGLKDAGVALMCGAILLVACSIGVDMQQDRSTGWRLKTNRTIQFRFQAIGIVMGAVMTVAFAHVFMEAYPVLRENTFVNKDVPGADKWQSAMTYKFVGAIKGITESKPHVMKALWIGLAIGLTVEILRKLLKAWKEYQDWIKSGKLAYGVGFVVDAVVLPSPYASSFGGFVEFTTSLWFGVGGVMASYAETIKNEALKDAPKAPAGTAPDIPEDMSTTSLVGGGLIAGDSIAALSIGVYGLLSQVFG